MATKIYSFVLTGVMFSSWCSLDGSPFHKVGAEFRKAVYEKSGQWV